MKRTMLILTLCLMAALMLTACHTETDPWPATTAAPEAVQVNPALATGETAPLPQSDPAQESTVDDQTQEIELPGGDEAPGLNG